MARVSVRMFATVREAAGRSHCELEAATLAELLEALGARFGPRLSMMLQRAGRGPDGVVVLVNGMNVSMTAQDKTVLHEGDDVAIFPPVSGG